MRKDLARAGANGIGRKDKTMLKVHYVSSTLTDTTPLCGGEWEAVTNAASAVTCDDCLALLFQEQEAEIERDAEWLGAE